ncbi:hypothetical protein K469DRAFT_733292 [Zopfia rhizophila CBS 207.26]|uniref:BHLH domain-containing protein n=1 Tax=Zopfia rhizophila CBS 207.26 TaxID=1314779 RepID=A0A6A6EIU1_9PEZI|nr:hypothetical protein K469DRAFT_733292 [Zopfia rhizophila CBS 207.26]
MDSRDPPPFGYTFDTGDFDFGGSPTDFTNGGPSLLSENENQALEQFFANTDPFLADTSFNPSLDTKGGVDDYNWGYPPPTIHGVSTTIADQTQLQHSFHSDQAFATDPFAGLHLASTQDDLQAASTLFSNAQASHANGRSYSVPDGPSSSTDPSNLSTTNFYHPPTVPTSHGQLDEQLASLLPNHSENGSIDATLAAQFTQIPHHHAAQLAQINRTRPHLKRAYTYGTDNSFNSSGFVVSSPLETEAAVTRRLMHDLRTAQPLTKNVVPSEESTKPSSPVTQKFPIGIVEIPSDEDSPSEDETSGGDNDDEHDRRPKKRRKARNSSPGQVKAEKIPGSARKSISSARPAKGRKQSLDENAGKKKRPSSAGQKAQRENLTEEQKRNNHILSEQKRRNLIKRGFDDLHDLVPEIRNGGLSKSSVLMEAVSFLEKLVEDNAHYIHISQSADG